MRGTRQIIFVLGTIGLIAWGSFFLARFTKETDFPVFYYAASTVLDPAAPLTSLYNDDIVNKYSIPEKLQKHAYIYSVPVAYILAPLALMPYYTAKAVMIFFNIVAYIAALGIIMRFRRVSGRWFAYPLALSCLWLPFIQNMRAAQVNALLLFLVAVALLLASKKRGVFCGILIGIAALFKLFPFGIAMVLGLKNWRIPASCAVVLGFSFIIPGSTQWLTVIGKIYKDYTAVYLFLRSLGSVWFILYAAAIAGTTAMVAYRTKGADYPLLAAFAIPAVLLTMPIVEYYHLTFLMLSYVCVLTYEELRDWSLLGTIVISGALISSAFFFNQYSYLFVFRPLVSSTLVFLGLFVFWASLALRLFPKMRQGEVG